MPDFAGLGQRYLVNVAVLFPVLFHALKHHEYIVLTVCQLLVCQLRKWCPDL